MFGPAECYLSGKARRQSLMSRKYLFVGQSEQNGRRENGWGKIGVK